MLDHERKRRHRPPGKIERQVFRDNMKNCRAALRMIREAVETYAPPGSVTAEEYVEPPFTAEAEVLVRGILAIVASKR